MVRTIDIVHVHIYVSQWTILNGFASPVSHVLPYKDFSKHLPSQAHPFSPHTHFLSLHCAPRNSSQTKPKQASAPRAAEVSLHEFVVSAWLASNPSMMAVVVRARSRTRRANVAMSVVCWWVSKLDRLGHGRSFHRFSTPEEKNTFTTLHSTN